MSAPRRRRAAAIVPFVPGAAVFRAGWQLTKLRWVVPLALLVSGLLLWVSWTVLHEYGVHPSEGGVLKPLPLRASLSALFLVLGLGCGIGIVVYVHGCYVSRIDAGDAPGRYRVTVAGLLRRRTIEVDAAALAPATYHDGVYRAGGMRGAAPWYTLRLPGRRLPLVVDAQGEVLDEAAFRRLVG